MKKINLLTLLGLSVFTLTTWTACSDDEYTPGPAVEGQGLYFSSEQSNQITVNEPEGSFTLDLYRSQTDGAIQAEVTATISEGGESLFTVPASVSFADGVNKASLSINYQGLERDVPYQISLGLKETTPYGIPSLALTVICPLIWETVSTNAIYIDNLFEPFGAGGIQISEITVEKHPDQNKYRFKSPYDNSYFEYLFGLTVFDNGFEAPYIVLDGETYPGSYFIASTSLGWKMVNGSGPETDETWATFGSFYGNLTENIAAYPLGTYDEVNKVFNFGAIYHNIDGVGEYPLNGATLLYLEGE